MSECNFTASVQVTICKMSLKIILSKLLLHIPGTYEKMHLKISFAICLHFAPGLNVFLLRKQCCVRDDSCFMKRSVSLVTNSRWGILASGVCTLRPAHQDLHTEVPRTPTPSCAECMKYYKTLFKETQPMYFWMPAFYWQMCYDDSFFNTYTYQWYMTNVKKSN